TLTMLILSTPSRLGRGGGSGLELPAKQAGVEVVISLVRESRVMRVACVIKEVRDSPYSP
ncbi:MAG: hypothetical protein J6V31_05065, partial [Tidjanibacter sp.]|nr:hypothetical protein [Tidjanibacter sp.]